MYVSAFRAVYLVRGTLLAPFVQDVGGKVNALEDKDIYRGS